MYRRYTFLLRPTSKQTDALNATLAIHCEVYNAALEHRREAYRKAGTSIGFFEQCRQLTEVRQIRPDVAAVSAKSLSQTLRRLDKAFQAFFRRMKAGENPGYPRFKSVHRFNSMTFHQAPADGGLRSGRLHVPGIGSVRTNQHRPIPIGAVVKQVQVRREGRRWYAVLFLDAVPARKYPEPKAGAVGIDLGIANLVTTSAGQHYANPRHQQNAADLITSVHRRLELHRRGSSRRRQIAQHLAILHARVARQRLDAAHKTALALIRDHDVIAHEALVITSMVRRPKPKPNGDGTYAPNGAAAKTGLNRSIHDAGWGVLLRVLTEKAEEAARTVIAVDPRHTSQRCHECGHVAAGNRVTQAKFECQACGHVDHADVNAAKNILRAGLALREAS